jgi:hypothetical protein
VFSKGARWLRYFAAKNDANHGVDSEEQENEARGWGVNRVCSLGVPAERRSGGRDNPATQGAERTQARCVESLEGPELKAGIRTVWAVTALGHFGLSITLLEGAERS